MILSIVASLSAAAIWDVLCWAVKKDLLWIVGLGGLLTGCGFSALIWWWHFRARIGFGERIEGSAFEFHRLIRKARKSVFAIGPTLIFLTQKQEIKKLLFEKLANPDFQVSLLVCDPESATAQLWNEIGYGQNFYTSIHESITVFQSWLDKKDKPNLTIKTVGPVTASLVFIDASDENGQLLIIPLPWRVPGENRPCFMISKKFHESAFNTYYDSYRELFKNTVANDITPKYKERV
jgi:hypothetical protein